MDIQFLVRHVRRARASIFFPFLNHRAVIGPNGRWKLVSDDGEPWELDNLRADRTELNELAGIRPAKRNALAKKWDAWWNKFQNKRPNVPNAGPPRYRALGEHAPSPRTLRRSESK